MSVLAHLAALRRLLALRRGAVLALGVLAAAGALFALAALGARAGALGAVRWLPLAVWLAALGAAGWAAWRVAGLLRTGGRRELRETARLVERELTLRHGALVGVVDLASGAPAGMSPALADRAASRLGSSLPSASPAWAPVRTAALGRRVRFAAALLAVSAGAVALSFWYAGDAAAALVTPLRAVRAAAQPRVTLELSARRVPRGADVTVQVHALPLSRPVLYVRSTGEPWRPLTLDADEHGTAAHRFPAVQAALFLYATHGGAVSDTVRVEVVAPPFVAEFSVTARYPAYLDRPDEPLVLESGPLLLPVGTTLSLRGAASAPLAAARLAGPADTLGLEVAGARFAGELVVRGTATWKLALRDALGSALPEPLPSLDVRAVPDSAPVVTIPVPGADTTAPLDLKPALVVDARDDHALGRVEIVSWRVSRLGLVGDTVVDSVPGAAGAGRLVQSQVLDLTARGLLPGDSLRYFVRALDRAPTPHEGRSREYVLRLRSLAELREAVREEADSLAAAAGELAADQTALSRRTEELAAQRNRGADNRAQPNPPNTPPGRDAARPDQRTPESGAMPFEQAEQARRVAEQQEALAERADSLRRELERLADAAEEAGLNDPEWRRQLENLEELMRQAVTPEMRERLEELQRALQRLDPQAVQQALRNLTEQQRQLREQLQRSAELFERAAIEGSMQTFAHNAEALRQAQEEWNRTAEGQRDSAAAAAEERRLRQQADSLAAQLQALSQRMERRGDTASAGEVSRAGDSTAAAAEDMQEAAEAMASGERPRASREGRQASERMRNVPRQLNQQRDRMAQAWRQEVLRAMDDAMSETIALAAEEQRLGQALREGQGSADARGRQAALEQGVQQLARRLQDAAGRNALVNPRLGSSLAQAREMMSQSREALEGPSPNPDEAAQRSQGAARALAQAAYQMMRNRNEVAGSQSGSGMAEAMERMAQMAGQQGALNDELGGMLPMLGNGEQAMMARLRELASRQRGLANDLERLGEAGIPGRPEELAAEARALADRMDQNRLDRGTLERQQRLFRRMLDAGRTLRDNNDEPEDPERKSNTAGDVPARAAPGAASGSALRYPVPPWSVLRELAPAERALVLDYFRRLNARP